MPSIARCSVNNYHSLQGISQVQKEQNGNNAVCCYKRDACYERYEEVPRKRYHFCGYSWGVRGSFRKAVILNVSPIGCAGIRWEGGKKTMQEDEMWAARP